VTDQDDQDVVEDVAEIPNDPIPAQCRGCADAWFEKFITTDRGPVATRTPRTAAQWPCASCCRKAPDRMRVR